MGTTVEDAVALAFKREWGRIVATLIGRTGNWDLAEDCAQEAFAQALTRWPIDGVPRQPGAWLTTVAFNRARDRLRRLERGAELLQQIGSDPTATRASVTEPGLAESGERCKDDVIEDDRLRLMFTCCHPALPLEGRVALTLRTLAGLTTHEIANAFLVPTATMGKRLTRAKAKISGAGIPYKIPSPAQLPERLGGVLAVLYLLFNEGYAASDGEQLIRGPLCAEAIRLTSVLVELMPDEPEASGLLALMLLNDSRRTARIDNDGELVTLEDQDRSLWTQTQIDEGVALLESALRHRRPGPYQLQAAIVACHAQAPSASATDWAQIAALYGVLRGHLPSPVVELNRAVAVAMAGDLDAGLALVEELAGEGPLSGYYLLDATRADLHRRRGEPAQAIAAYRRALALNPPGPERRFLQRRIRELTT